MKISVVIPVKNGAATLRLCLEKITTQTIGNLEIILLDSMSDDDSKSIGLEYGATIINIPNGTFNHGLTRNLGVLHTTGDLVYLTVQDAWLSENDMLERMANHFYDNDVQAVAGHQATPWGHADKNPAYWFKRYSKPEIGIRHFPNNSFEKLSLRDQFEQSGWDNVNAMYRKTALTKIPFAETNFSEDWFWAKEALHAGIKLIYDPSIVVHHYHHQTFRYKFNTDYTLNYHLYKEFKQLPVISWSPLRFIRASFTIVKRNEVTLIKKPFWILHNLGIYTASLLSAITFRIAFLLGKEKMLNKSHSIFCKEIPQGRIKN